MTIWMRGTLTAAGLIISLLACTAPARTVASPIDSHAGSVVPGQYIVALRSSVKDPGAVGGEQVEQHQGKLLFVYRHAVEGYAASGLSDGDVRALRKDPRVKYVVPNHYEELFSQTTPTGISRIFAPSNQRLAINASEDFGVDADVAVIDTGIDRTREDLNVFRWTSCGAVEQQVTCVDGAGTDTAGHGTHVAGTIGAIDDGSGVVGVAPGVRLWAVKTDESGLTEASLAAGVDWVTAHADEIEVVNISIGCPLTYDPNTFQPIPCPRPLMYEAISKSVEAGVVYAVAAGNVEVDAKYIHPANHPDVITVSSLVDTDGKPGALGPGECYDSIPGKTRRYGDDVLSPSSDWGSLVEVAAPGVCILSTHPAVGFGTMSGTSMASPHVAGAAALLASRSNPSDKEDVEAIRQTIIETGNYEWTDTSGDGIQEPLLDVSDEEVYDPVLVVPESENDVNGDGRSDLIGVDASGAVQVFAGANSGIGASSSTASLSGQIDPALYDGDGHYLIDTADVNGDGRSDLVTIKGTGGVYVHLANAARTYSPAIEARPTTLKPVMNGAGSFEPFGAADMNGDKRADLVGLDGSTIKTYLGQSNGTFAEPLSKTWTLDSPLFDNVGRRPLGLGDLNGDGYAELVTAEEQSGEVAIYRGTSEGTFDSTLLLPMTLYPVNPIFDNGQGVEPVGLGDVSGDGRADLLVLNGTTLRLYEGKADSEGKASLKTTPTTPYAGSIDSSLLDGVGEDLVGLLDYSGDGRADLVSVDGQGDTRSYTAQSNSTFAAPSTSAGSIVTSRLDRGGLELASEKPFLRRAECSAGGCKWPPKGREDDVNGDGRSDLIGVDSAGTVQVFAGANSGIGASNPTASLSGQVDPALYDGGGHYLIDTADVTGDGRSDLITQGSAGGIKTHPGQADRSFGAAISAFSGLPPVMNGAGVTEPVAVADANGDGKKDLIFVSHYLMAPRIYPGNGDGTFSAGAVPSFTVDPALLDGSGTYFVDAADVTGDGLADLVGIDTAGVAKVYRGQSGGTFTGPVTTASVDPIFDNGSGEEPIGVGDVDGDGKADLLTLSGSTLKLRKGQASGTFATATTPYAGSIDSSLLDGVGEDLVGLLDYNRDARADLVSVDGQGDTRSYTAQSNSTFAAPSTSAGSIVTSRLDRGGLELASEKPFLRRAECSAGGCKWPPEG